MQCSTVVLSIETGPSATTQWFMQFLFAMQQIYKSWILFLFRIHRSAIFCCCCLVSFTSFFVCLYVLGKLLQKLQSVFFLDASYFWVQYSDWEEKIVVVVVADFAAGKWGILLFALMPTPPPPLCCCCRSLPIFMTQKWADNVRYIVYGTVKWAIFIENASINNGAQQRVQRTNII